MTKKIIIQGIRGVPASHGGFETFAENLSTYLIDLGWEVTVYCQESTNEYSSVFESAWNGVRRIHIPVEGDGAKSTVVFDYLSVKHASTQPGLVLTLGYNTALFNLWFRFKQKTNLINMDGIEWKRDKWKWYERLWLYLNERAGCLIGNHLIADHPEIKKHLVTRVNPDKVEMIPYGARLVVQANEGVLSIHDLQIGGYALVIARPEPENSILEIVSAFSVKKRNKNLVVLGEYDKGNPYQCSVLDAASDEVKFIGAVYEHESLDSLRFFSCLYIHGHTVGGTNPSLVEALGAGQPVLAHDNEFNRWVSGEEASYFNDMQECSEKLDLLLSDDTMLKKMSVFSSKRFDDHFTWNSILQQYESLLLKWL